MVGVALTAAACDREQSQSLNAAVIGTGELMLGDPLLPPANESQAVLRTNIAQGLVRFDAAGEVEPGLAERWNVSDDGLSYIFRLQSGEWPDGRRIMARDVARLLTRMLRADRDGQTRDALGAIEEVVAMTERVIEIRLTAPRPNLLQVLAQPELALIREGVGSGPFAIRKPEAPEPGESAVESDPAAPLELMRRFAGIDGEPGEREDVRLSTMPAADGIKAFRAGTIDLLLGGTVDDLPLATGANLDNGVLRFDPVGGLFGLVPAREDGPLAVADVRQLLSQAIDRDALIAALKVPGLGPRATVLEGGLGALGTPVQPPWLALPMAERQSALLIEAERLFGDTERPSLKVALPPGPGGDMLFARLSADWGLLGIAVERVAPGRPADFMLIDAVAPSNSPAWYLRRFRCGNTPICVEEADEMLAAAREAPVSAQRAALLQQAADLMDQAALFLPLAAPVRWSLVGDRAAAFQENRFARHPLAGMMGQTDTRGFSP